MSDDDQEPSSDPFGSPESQPGERSMTYFGAIGWTLLSTTLWVLTATLLAVLRPNSNIDLVVSFGAQAASGMFVLFCIMRLYAPDLSIRHFVGLRNTHGLFFVFAAMLGFVIQIPASALYDWILRRSPLEDDSDAALLDLMAQGASWRAIVFFILVLAGPFVEEVFFRGVLYRPLKKEGGGAAIILVSSILFAFSHLERQRMLPILIVGLALGILRHCSGSLLPSFIMHATLNGASFWPLYEQFRAGGKAITDAPPPLRIVAAASLSTLVLLVLVYIVGARSDSAAEARSEDLL